MFDEIVDGRTDLVFDYLAEGNAANATDRDGVSLIQWCAYYGDVSAIRFLLANGASLESLGDDRGLIGACFHGHWRLCKFLVERGADVNHQMRDTGETPLHSALCTTRRLTHNLVLRVLLAHGANPNCVTKESVETGGFMRDCRTKGETPLHRAAAFGDEEAIQLRDEFADKSIPSAFPLQNAVTFVRDLWSVNVVSNKLQKIVYFIPRAREEVVSYHLEISTANTGERIHGILKVIHPNAKEYSSDTQTLIRMLPL